MNANELADGLDEDGYHNCADMLRQQQAEIEALKAKQSDVLREVKTSWTAISPVGGITRESAHKLHEVIKDILK